MVDQLVIATYKTVYYFLLIRNKCKAMQRALQKHHVSRFAVYMSEKQKSCVRFDLAQ